jgi:hypothetical protein
MPRGPESQAKAIAAARWPWLDWILAAWAAAMLALFLGILTFAAVREMTIECKREPLPIFKLEDGISDLVTEEKYLRCRFGLGDRSVTFP